MTELQLLPGAGFAGLLVLMNDGITISVWNIWADSSSPVSEALDDAVRVARRYDLLRRLHSAWMDLDQCLYAARALLEAEEASRARFDVDDDELEDPHYLAGPLREVVEAGMVTLYARHFDGARELPRRWWPRGKRKAIHEALVVRRNTIVAHADETTERTLVPFPTAGPGPPVAVLAEARQPIISIDDLREYIHHFESLWKRYSDAVLEIKHSLGIAASGEVFGPHAYDE